MIIYNNKEGSVNMKIARGWKLFEMDSKGRLFPLFIGKKEETKMSGLWHKLLWITRALHIDLVGI